jgi:DNA-binding phage protein
LNRRNISEDFMADSNGYDGEEIQRFLNAISHEHDELDKLKSAYMLKCKGPRGKIKGVMKSARDSEVNLVAFRAAVKKYLDDRKHQKRLAGLEDDDAEAYDLIVEALGGLGDTPLGQAALARAKPKGAELDSLKA